MKKVIVALMSFCLLLVGCSSKNELVSNGQASNVVTEIRFKDMVQVEELRKLDGKKVKITGFMAETSPLDGSMIYLMNMPYQSCVYCLPNTNKLVNTMAVYPKSGKYINYTDLAVEIVGTIKFETITDEMGYSYDYRIIDAEINHADVDTLNEEVKIYTDLVNQGFVNSISEVILAANKVINYEALGTATEDLEEISTEQLDKIDSMFKDLVKLKYTDIKEVVSKLRTLVNDLNDVIKAGEYVELSKFKNKEMDIFYEVYDWLMKPEL